MIRKIIVPTDFSAPANGAASYALHIAKYLKCNMALCHSFVVPADLSNADTVSWPLYDYDTLKEEAIDMLAGLSRKLIRMNTLLKTPNTFKPIVDYYAEALPVPQLLNQHTGDTNPALVIAGSSGTGAVTRFFTGSTTRRLIEAAAYPVLLVPPEYPFRAIHKIAFTSDLDPAGIQHIHVLAGFARHFDAEIVITHINPLKEDAKKARDFLLEVTSKINYDKIYYREINTSSVSEGLNQIAENGWADLLVMVHKQGSPLERLLKGSYTKRQISHLKIPMLALPEGTTHIFGIY